MTIKEFWRITVPVVRLALLCALAATIVNAASYVGLAPRGPFLFVWALHLVVMALGLVLFVRLGYHHRLAARSFGSECNVTRSPRSLHIAAGLSFVYMVFLFAYFSANLSRATTQADSPTHSGGVMDSSAPSFAREERVADSPESLRLFSAAWLFFALVTAIAAHHTEARIRDFKAVAASAAV